MQNDRRLVEHYDKKYGDSNSSLVRPVLIVNHPRDRFEMTSLKAFSNEAGGRYLEVGAGSGNIALTLLEKYDELVLTDLSTVRANELKNLFRHTAKVRASQHNIETESLDFSDNYFDTTVMVAVIEHLVDPLPALKELHRVLKPGGRLIIDTPNIAKWTRRIKLLFGYFPSTASLNEGLLSYDKKKPTDLYDDGHLHYFTFRSLSRLCIERIGFRRIDRFGYGSWKTTRCPWFLSRLLPTVFSEIFIVAYK